MKAIFRAGRQFNNPRIFDASELSPVMGVGSVKVLCLKAAHIALRAAFFFFLIVLVCLFFYPSRAGFPAGKASSPERLFSLLSLHDRLPRRKGSFFCPAGRAVYYGYVPDLVCVFRVFWMFSF